MPEMTLRDEAVAALKARPTAESLVALTLIAVDRGRMTKAKAREFFQLMLRHPNHGVAEDDNKMACDLCGHVCYIETIEAYGRILLVCHQCKVGIKLDLAGAND